MEGLIEASIEHEAKKRLSKYSREWYYIHKYQRTFAKRTGKQARRRNHVLPRSWSHNNQFDPRYCLNHAKFLARGIWAALQDGSYRPVPSLRIEVPKATGGVRTIDVFSVPDAAVAKIFLDNLRTRNSKIFSDSSYAYQHNKAPLDAVIRLKSALKPNVLFISQYDFSSYFDSIGHNYLRSVLAADGPFLTTSMERRLIETIITHQYSNGTTAAGNRVCGTPQGHSLSLFIANVAAHPLDEELGRLNGSFARFADDSVVVNTSYEDALRTADAFHKFSAKSGVRINSIKSSGIRMFSDTTMEMSHISEFDFLGYKFRRDGLFVGDRAKAAIKRRCSRILYNHLLLHLRRTNALSRRRIGRGFSDWDLVTCLNELRSFIYGGSSQRSIDSFLAGTSARANIAGAVSYFALVDDGAIFRELDGWLADVTYRSYTARTKLAASLAGRTIRPLSKMSLITGRWYRFPSIPMETQLPSFFTAWRAARKSWSQHGLGGIDPQGMGYSYT